MIFNFFKPDDVSQNIENPVTQFVSQLQDYGINQDDAANLVDTFAANGHTSARELRDTYLKDIKLAQLAKESREAIPERSWAMVRRVTP